MQRGNTSRCRCGIATLAIAASLLEVDVVMSNEAIKTLSAQPGVQHGGRLPVVELRPCFSRANRLARSSTGQRDATYRAASVLFVILSQAHSGARLSVKRPTPHFSSSGVRVIKGSLKWPPKQNRNGHSTRG